MKKVYFIENLGCANCAAKMEEKINALPQVEAAVLTFATRQLQVTAENPGALLEQMQKIVASIEPDAKITDRACSHHHSSCTCGHDHHEHSHTHGHSRKEPAFSTLLPGGGLFVLGVFLSFLPVRLPGVLAFLVSWLLLGLPVLKKAGSNLVAGDIFDENFLMSLATVGAIVIGEFPEAAGIMLFYRLGEFFEEKAVQRSRRQIMDAVDLRPETVTLLNGQTVPAEQAAVGQLLQVRPGDRIPLDGVVVDGSSRIDTAPITGEPVPVAVKAGDAVISGCVNTSGLLTLRVEKTLSESMVTRILRAVESAAASKPKIDRFITRFARVYTPVVVISALLVAVVPPIFGGSWRYWVYTALSFLVMSCPCALVLSVPLAFFSGIGVGSSKGILFKGGAAIEALAGIKAVALDKTGTVTKGEFQVQNQVAAEVLQVCASCEQASTHPIGVSIVSAAKSRGLSLKTPSGVQELPGQGIQAQLEGKTVLCGSAELLRRHGITPPPVTEAGSVVYVAEENLCLGYILVSDSLKPDARQTVSRLKAMGISAAMLTGDNRESAQAFAKAAGISQVHAQLLPEDKLRVLQTIRKTHGAVMFVGDGINDAPVLAGADVGAAMGSGADAAMEAADVVFMTSEVSAVAEAIVIARRTRQIALQNIIFALAVKLAVMVLGLLGYASMWSAVFADSGVALLCVLNSVRQLYKK